MTSAQWQRLLDMLGNSNLKNNPDCLSVELSDSVWLIDSGASRRFTCKFDLLHNLREMTECSVGLPDGKNTIATKKGDVHLTKGIVLRDVFCVPQLNCNLISVTQLCDDLNCLVFFTKTLCVIQDQHLRILIGVGERRDGLYYF